MAAETLEAQDLEFLDSAEQAKAPPPQNRHLFGRMKLEWQYVALVRGSGKVPWNPRDHTEEQKLHGLEFVMDPLPSNPNQFQTKRNVLAESTEFETVIRPSLTKLNQRLSAVAAGVWCEVEMVPTRKYASKTEVDEAGKPVMKNATVPAFRRIFPDEAACEAASADFFKRSPEAASGNGSSGPSAPPPPEDKPLSLEGRQTALATVYQVAGRDATRFMEMIKGMPQFADLRLDSPEVQQLLDKPF